MTYWIVTQTDRFKAAVSDAGLTNLASYYAQSDIQSVWAYRTSERRRGPIPSSIGGSHRSRVPRG